jgi:putative membrane protein
VIVENATNAYRLLRARWSLIPVVLAILLLVEVANDYIRLDRAAFSLAAVGLLVTALSIFLVFRVNEAYARWWEARGLWGQLVNSSRSFARQATTLIIAKSNDEAAQREEPALRRELVYRQIAFVNALRLSLRRQDRWDELAPFLGDEERERLTQAVNKPTQILQRQGERIAEARAAGLLSEIGQLQMDRTLSVLHDVQGACERIKTTPFPDKVAYITWLTAWIMAVMIAIAVTDPDNRFDLVDMVVVPLLMLGFVLIERLGAELKNPFENAPNDTPMTALSRTIERDLRQTLGEEELPPPIEPVDGVLM